MNTTERVTPPSSRATSGGTSATLSQYPVHDDKNHFLPEQSPREMIHAVASSEHSAIASSRNIEQPRAAVNSSHSSRSSSLSSVLHHQGSLLSSDSLRGLSENFGHMNIESTIVPPEVFSVIAEVSSSSLTHRLQQTLLKSRDRVRELSAPLPSVPPSTPASAVSHRSSFSQSQKHYPTMSPSFLSQGSPIFTSPLTEHSDSEDAEQDMTELSDSNSIEIISGYVLDPFVTSRYKDSRNTSRNVSQSAQSSYSIAPSLSSRAPNLNDNTGAMVQQVANLSSSTSAVLSTSQTPTPHPVFQNSSSPTHTIDEELKSTTETSDNSPVSPSSDSASPSRAQPRSGTKADSRLSMETSSPIAAHGPEKSAYEPRGTTEAKLSQDTEDVARTPNVYINGLPPHFPDESLYLMTRDFGNVLSVRTFTRCVGEKMSGYGFVLFDSVDSAGRCIETLRKYRNLHPSFSKQIHKIPGTPYASGTITLPPAGSLPSLPSQSSMSTLSSLPSMASTLVSSTTSSSLHMTSSSMKKYSHHVEESISTTSGSDFGGKDMKDLSFREKMERLKDERSTNLYMEGLPLAIDDVSLAALVSPHKVISSRFFQTKLSNPPRMIAFVRLDTRAGAEEVIDRLHGRVVRGWNDNGCRISVRFADTNEQRELRRAERLNRGEDDMDNGPQLSMAHAALLNLRGAEAQARLGSIAIHPQPQLTDLDHRPPVTLPGSQLANTHAGSDVRNTDSFQRLNVAQDFARANGNIRPTVHVAQHYHHMSAAQQRPLTNPFGDSAPERNTFNSRASLVDKTAMSTRSIATPYHSSDSSGFSTKFSDSSQLALLQQQNQLQQLQLLRQLQNAALDPSYTIGNHRREEAHPLMPSADIMPNGMDISHLQISANHLLSGQGAHRRQGSLSQVQQHGPYDNGGVPDLSGSAPRRSGNGERYPEHRGGDDQPTTHQHQYAVNQSLTSPAPAYNTHFLRTRTSHHDGLISNSDHPRGGILEDGEVTLISPALTYTSRTPSTLSPATPLFNTFGTPASVPATVPRGKTNVRERDYLRLYKNELRQ